jgi:hypothetical protein
MWRRKKSKLAEIDGDWESGKIRSKVADRPHLFTLLGNIGSPLVAMAALAVSLSSLWFNQEVWRDSKRARVYITSMVCSTVPADDFSGLKMTKVECVVKLRNQGGSEATLVDVKLRLSSNLSYIVRYDSNPEDTKVKPIPPQSEMSFHKSVSADLSFNDPDYPAEAVINVAYNDGFGSQLVENREPLKAR